MSTFKVTIDGREVEAQPGQTVLDVARGIGIDIPTLCHLEKCGPLNSCLVCLVKVLINGQGRMVPSCGTKVAAGMVIESETVEVHDVRRTALELLFSDHVGDCLSPCNRLCPLQLNIPLMMRQIQSEHLDEALLTVRDALPLAGILGRLCHHPCEQGCRRANLDNAAAIKDLERFVTDRAPAEEEKSRTRCKPSSGKNVAIVGAGPAGLSAAFTLRKEGHAVVVLDRGTQPGGTLRAVPEAELEAGILEREIALLKKLGVEFKPSTELGVTVSLAELETSHGAVLITIGEASGQPGLRSDLAMTGAALKVDPNTFQTSRNGVFAAGAVMKPVKQVVRAMAEGRTAAECVNQYLLGKPLQKGGKQFSSVMGRLSPGELRTMLLGYHASEKPRGCDRCATMSRPEAVLEASRCMHCDCESSGHCALQHYAQVYDVDANHYKSERRTYAIQQQPGGVIFEPGKCIICGICVRLTELASEPLGLSFIGRGFDVRVAAPFNRDISDGLRSVAAECVRECPTGALNFAPSASDSKPTPPAAS